jgi:hypothetical protein
MRRFRKRNGTRRYPAAHAAGFNDRCRFVESGPHGPASPIGACHEWIGPRSRKGYGKVFVNGRNIDAHRHAWSLTNDHQPIPSGMQVLHRCDNPPCVLGEHLFLGTHAENMQDMSRKKRRSWAGVSNPNCRLSDEQVADIRARYIPRKNGAQLAREFGCSLSTITNIAAGRSGRYRVTPQSVATCDSPTDARC